MPKLVSPQIDLTGGVQDYVPRIVWANVEPGDTLAPLLLKRQFGFVGCVQMSGTWGGATVALEQSNDAETWFQAYDPVGAAIEATADAMFEISLAAAYFKPDISAGAGSNINVILVLRG